MCLESLAHTQERLRRDAIKYGVDTYRKLKVLESAMALVEQQGNGSSQELIAKTATDFAEYVAAYEESIEGCTDEEYSDDDEEDGDSVSKDGEDSTTVMDDRQTGEMDPVGGGGGGTTGGNEEMDDEMETIGHRKDDDDEMEIDEPRRQDDAVSTEPEGSEGEWKNSDFFKTFAKLDMNNDAVGDLVKELKATNMGVRQFLKEMIALQEDEELKVKMKGLIKLRGAKQPGYSGTLSEEALEKFKKENGIISNIYLRNGSTAKKEGSEAKKMLEVKVEGLSTGVYKSSSLICAATVGVRWLRKRHHREGVR